ncbi:uncharacterized protein LOC127279587 [Leptopilina boulardi]|uniref:uncharacterized protein LOC127279587 n=1 Tax=Leptopilina boulardi TaxID=63433 RepID=UPI0021F5B06E|nr:uncharacterized protein LOC127279587 [Leptopilina boulardi]
MDNQVPGPSSTLRTFINHVYNDFEYVVHSSDNDKTSFVCKDYKSGTCRGKGFMKAGIFTLKKRHTHYPDLKNLREKEFKMALYNAVTTSTETFRKCYDKVRPSHHEASITLPFASCENPMYKWRKRISPPSPPPFRTLDDYCNTLNSDEWKHIKEDLLMFPRYLEKTQERPSFIKISTVQTKFTEMETSILMQRLKWCLEQQGIPFAWAIMEQKTAAAYKKVSQEIKRLLPGFNIIEAMCDFESALKKALRQSFPGIILHGCLFHYKQANIRKTKNLRLHQLLKKNPEARHALHLIIALLLLPAGQI